MIRKQHAVPRTAIYLIGAIFLVVAQRVESVRAGNPKVDYVIHISVDGLRGSAIQELGPTKLPNFYRVRAEGAYTDNARNLFEQTVTMPNHVTEITGRPRDGVNGHHVSRNGDPGIGMDYVPGSVGITSAPNEFIRGTGALRIDDGSGANYVHVDGNVVAGGSGPKTKTVMGWYRYEDINSSGSDERNFVWESGPDDYSLSFGLRDSGGEKRAQWFTTDPSTGGATASLPIGGDGAWHHAAVVMDEAANNLKFYQDGVLEDNATIANYNLADGEGAKEFFIGSHRAGDGSRNWDGFIDDLAVVDKALSPTQISNIFNGTQTVSQVAGADLRAYWTFDNDLSSQVNNGVYQGTAVFDTGQDVTVHTDSAAAGGPSYIVSTFDVVHDHGGKTAFYAGWNGFNFLDRSWDANNGAPDTTGVDNGTDKIDKYVLVTDNNIHNQTTTLIDDMTSGDPNQYSLIHWHDTDAQGHTHGWTSQQYLDAVEDVDAELGRLMDVINADPALANHTAIVLTTDHGGFGYGHGDTTQPEIYTIPFYAWVSGQQVGEELYDLNSTVRTDPGGGRPGYLGGTLEPIRNGDAGNLAMDLLGLPAIPGSVFDSLFDLQVVGTISGDLNSDDTVDLDDWAIFIAGHGGDFTGLSAEQAYSMGDIDGDLDNDLDDFILFNQAYDAAHGVGALAAALTVPEPSSFIVLMLGCYCAATARGFTFSRTFRSSSERT